VGEIARTRLDGDEVPRLHAVMHARECTPAPPPDFGIPKTATANVNKCFRQAWQRRPRIADYKQHLVGWWTCSPASWARWSTQQFLLQGATRLNEQTAVDGLVPCGSLRAQESFRPDPRAEQPVDRL